MTRESKVSKFQTYVLGRVAVETKADYIDTVATGAFLAGCALSTAMSYIRKLTSPDGPVSLEIEPADFPRAPDSRYVLIARPGDAGDWFGYGNQTGGIAMSHSGESYPSWEAATSRAAPLRGPLPLLDESARRRRG